MRPELDNVLQCLFLNGYSVLSLISDILSHGSNEEDQRTKCLLEGVEQDAVNICACLLNHNTTSSSVSTWALGVALQSQTRKEHSPSFMTGHPLSLPNDDVVSPDLSFGTASTKVSTNSLEELLNIGRTRCTSSISGILTPTRSDSCTVVAMKYKRVVIIDPLPDDVFLEIFDLFLRDPTYPDEYPAERMRKWLILAHVCQRWRGIIFASPRRLDLYLACICGTPVRRNLVYWPLTLPLVIDYPGTYDGPIPGDEDNIIAALTHTDRIHRVNIYATYLVFLRVINVMQKSFPALTYLEFVWDVKYHQSPFPILPRGLLGGSAPRLEYLHLSGVSFPGLPTLLLSARNLLDLRLHDIMQNISLEKMVAGLAVLTRLRTFAIGFHSKITPSEQGRSRSNHPMPITLPALTLFRYQGYSEYLEDLLALINTPLVDTITIKYLVGDIQFLQLSQFIGRTKNLKVAQFRRAYVKFCHDQVNVELELGLPQGEPQSDVNLRLSLLGPRLNIQVPYVVDVLGKVVALFSNVGHLFTHASCLKWRDMADLDSIEWLAFLRLFPAVETLRLSGDMASYIVSALEDIPEEMLTEVMPALHLLWLDEEYRREEDEPVGSIKQFLTLRQLSGRPVAVVNTEDEFDDTLNENTQGPSEMPE